MANIKIDGDDGGIWVKVALIDTLLSAEVTAEDDRIADESVALATLRGTAVANAAAADDGSVEETGFLAEAATYLEKINRNTTFRAELADAIRVINELTVHRAE